MRIPPTFFIFGKKKRQRQKREWAIEYVIATSLRSSQWRRDVGNHIQLCRRI